MASRRFGVIVGILSVVLLAGLSSDRMVAETSGDRTISFYHIHTHEKLTVTYKKGGRYVPEALKQINWIMRDWRKNEQIAIDPATVDLAWEMHEELGSKEPINIICGYRSRGTNEMLRKTRGGQASQSQHMTGRAIDITFPDVPLKRMRYSALVRERGGVGYYPTSGIPFVHIDTARVRSWPRLPRYELALVFPNGRSKHMPASGGPITPSDVVAARAEHKELAMQVAQFQQIRLSPGKAASIQIAARLPSLKKGPAPASRDAGQYTLASLTPDSAAPRKIEFKPETPPAPKPFAAAAEKRREVASLEPAASSGRLIVEPGTRATASKAAEVRPANVQAPARKAVDAPARASDRAKLDRLVAQAAIMPLPKLVSAPKPAIRPQKALAAAAIEKPAVPAAPETQVASLTPDVPTVTDMSPDEPGNGWVQAPEFDEDHPEELAYRPFPLAPLLTDTPSAQDPQFSQLQHPDVAATLTVLDDESDVAPMKFRPGRQVAQVMWAQQFAGKAVHLDALMELDQQAAPSGLENRSVKTSERAF